MTAVRIHYGYRWEYSSPSEATLKSPWGNLGLIYLTAEEIPSDSLDWQAGWWLHDWGTSRRFETKDEALRFVSQRLDRIGVN